MIYSLFSIVTPNPGSQPTSSKETWRAMESMSLGLERRYCIFSETLTTFRQIVMLNFNL